VLTCPTCLGREAQEGQLFQGPILPLVWRGGPKKAVSAVAASILTTAYHMLKNGTQFQDLGATHFDRRSKDMRAKRLLAQLTHLGFEAKLTPLAQADVS
jgi:transposase